MSVTYGISPKVAEEDVRTYTPFAMLLSLADSTSHST